MAGWYYLENGAQTGPVTDEELLRKAAHNELQADDLVWSTGMPEWVPVSTVVDIEDAPAKKPPPAPGTKNPPPAPGAVKSAAAAPAAVETAGEEWFYNNDGEREGPFSILELGGLYKSRKLTKTDLVWSASLGDWTAVSDVEALIPYKPVGLAAPPKKKSSEKKTGSKKKKGIVIAKSKTKISTSNKSKIAGLTSTAPKSGSKKTVAKKTAAKKSGGIKISRSGSPAAGAVAAASTPADTEKPAGGPKVKVKPPRAKPAAAQGAVNPYSQPAATADGPAIGFAGGEVDSISIDMLSRTRLWVRIMSVLFFIWLALILIGAVVGLVMGLIAASQVGIAGLLPTLLSTLLSLCMAWLVAYPARKLWGYANSIQGLELSKDKKDLREALDKQRSYWMFTTIMTLIAIFTVPLIYLILFIFILGARGF